MAKHFIIYETKNLKNGKIYIGQHRTDDLNDGYLGSGYHLKRAIRYYGKEFFERKILFSFDNEEDMYSKEAELVNEEFLKRDDIYNLTIGGKPNWFNHKNHDILEICKKGRINANKKLAKKLKEDVEYKKYFSKKVSEGVKAFYDKGGKPSFEGRKHSEETKEKMKKSHNGKQKGEKNSQFGTIWIHNLETNQSKKIKRNDIIPNGWLKGRK